MAVFGTEPVILGQWTKIYHLPSHDPKVGGVGSDRLCGRLLDRGNYWPEMRIIAPTRFHALLLIKLSFRANNCPEIKISEPTWFHAVLLSEQPCKANNWPPI